MWVWDLDGVMNGDLLVPHAGLRRKKTKVRSGKGGVGTEEGSVVIALLANMETCGCRGSMEAEIEGTIKKKLRQQQSPLPSPRG